MRHYIFVPGFEGSALQLTGHPEAWPPAVSEVIFGYHRLAELLHPKNKGTRPVDAIGCHPVYQPLRDDLHDIAQHHGGTVSVFPYDWRTDVRTIRTRLAKAIKNAAASYNHITLVAHSGGGLVVRHVLENAGSQRQPWFGKVKKLVTIGTPHLGAPTILFKALGMEGSLGISPQDARTLMADTRYPAPYQALPRPGQWALWDITTGTPQPKDIYDPTVVAHLQLSAANVDAAAAAWRQIRLSRKPASVQYVLIAGTDQRTDMAVQYDARLLHPVQDYAGDGVIPTWSAAPPGTNSRTTPGDHTGMFTTYPFRRILYEVLCAPMPLPLVTEGEGATISLDRPVYAPSESATVLLVPDRPTVELDGMLTLTRLARVDELTFEPYTTELPIRYRGPTIEFLRLRVAVPSQDGPYLLALVGSHRTNVTTAGAFVVSRVATPDLRLPRQRA
jgi:hypothetical protein